MFPLWYFRPNDQHWADWPICKQIVMWTKNVIKEPLVNCDHIILSPLHIILGLMKQFFKALDQNAACFSYTCSELPNENQKAGLFDTTQIRKLINDENFVSHITEFDATAWTSLFFSCERFSLTKRNWILNKRLKFICPAVLHDLWSSLKSEIIIPFLHAWALNFMLKSNISSGAKKHISCYLFFAMFLFFFLLRILYYRFTWKIFSDIFLQENLWESSNIAIDVNYNYFFLLLAAEFSMLKIEPDKEISDFNFILRAKINR